MKHGSARDTWPSHRSQGGQNLCRNASTNQNHHQPQSLRSFINETYVHYVKPPLPDTYHEPPKLRTSIPRRDNRAPPAHFRHAGSTPSKIHTFHMATPIVRLHSSCLHSSIPLVHQAARLQ